MRRPSAISFLLLCLASSGAGMPPLHCYISTGDNQWLGQSLPIDSPAAIEASFDLLHRLGVKRVYWRGLEAATWVDTVRERPEAVRYFTFWKWLRRLYREVDPDRRAVEAAHRRGMEIWGVGNFADWGAQADAPPFKHYPYASESSLRLDHPHWAPVDRSGLLRQGGAIELAYPEARKALVDIHMKFMRRDGYDGMTFLSYAENHSMRFQDEFGYSPPIVEEFKRRHGIDIRYQEWTRFASRFDWEMLRGEYLTAFVRELKAELAKEGKKLGFFLQPWEPHRPQPWNVPELLLTGGSMYFDLETWIREGLVDDFLVYGYANPAMQVRAVRNLRWMTRDTPVSIGILTSGPAASRWKPFQDAGVPTVIAFGEDAMYLDRSFVPPQPMSSLRGEDPLKIMRALSQIIYGKSTATFDEVAPLARHPHLIVRRLALQALGKIGGPEAVGILEQALLDEENCIRCMAGVALRDAHGPDTAARILNASRLHGHHMLAEIMQVTLPRIRPSPRQFLAEAYQPDEDVKVRQIILRSLQYMADPSLLPVWQRAVNDPDRFTRLAALRGVGRLRGNVEAIELLLKTTGNPDPVTVNQAMVLLGEMTGRGDPAALRFADRIFEALRDRYARFGDAYVGADAEWGYRPVGNALLEFGERGEAMLQSFIDQSADRRLAINAWKSLYIRQRPGTFSQVTEKENEQAMRQRPIFLKRPVLDRLRQDFEDAALWQPGTRGMVGDVNRVAGRWGALLDEGPRIVRDQRGQALLIRRGGQSFSGQAVPAVNDQADYQFTCRLYRRDDRAALVIQLRGHRGAFQPEVSVNINDRGELRLRDARADRWVGTGLRVEARRWTRLRLLVNRRARTCTAQVDSGPESPPTPIRPQSNLRSVVLFPQPPEGSEVLVDDIALTEIR